MPEYESNRVSFRARLPCQLLLTQTFQRIVQPALYIIKGIHNKICEKAKLRTVRIHDLRHSYATIRIGEGHNIADVSRQLGHSSIKITVDTYYHWMPSQKREEVHELDNLGKKPDAIAMG